MGPAQIKTTIHVLSIEGYASFYDQIIGNLISSQELPGAKETQVGHFHHIPSFGCVATGAMRPAVTALI